MNKLLLVSLAAFASFGAMGSTITSFCTAFPVTFGVGVGSTTVSCPAFDAVANAATGLTSVTLNYYADYQFGTTGSNDIKITFSATNPGGVVWTNASQAVDVTGALNSANTSPAIPVANLSVSGVTLAAFNAAFNVGVASSVVSGGAATSSGGVSVTYNFTTAAPEPATISLIGLSLVGLGAFARRRRS